jgi:hypothetical protein
MIEFDAEIVKAQTMRDGGVRIVLDVPEYELEGALRMIALIGDKPMVRVIVSPKPEQPA